MFTFFKHKRNNPETEWNTYKHAPQRPFLADYIYIYTLPETNMAPENQWLEDKMFFWQTLFSGANR